ncbi:transcriptional regulator [Vallitalea longa]|uniref:Transcriptional regulator n=1 Tax=Vallitalea longa TaxID=2936439 RepID=A0A9W6DGD6_9FIRM|nr:LCP family protein [Vallitalea longa]GKX30437.1 transcriptional regulator [Vallitalea longa]
MNNNTKVSLLTKFLKVFLISVVIFSLIAGIATGGYILLNKDKHKSQDPTKTPSASTGDESGSTKDTEKEKNLTTFAVFGVDKDGYRTDVTMVMTFNHITKQINIVSIPRDTYVELPTNIYNELHAKRKDTPKKLKINEVPAYAPRDERNQYSIRMLEYMFDIKVDYYFNMNLKIFKDIVDIIGPIKFNVPRDMVYSAPDQNFSINLKKGEQELYGAQAEQLIRYRKGNAPGVGYANGDIGRIDVQHEFMKAFVNQLLTEENKYKIMTIGSTVITKTSTNFDALLEYYQYINDINVDNIEFRTLPQDPNKPNGNFYYCDQEASKKLFEEISQVNDTNDNENNTDGKDSSPEPEDSKIISSIGLNIEILNGSKQGGLAKRTKERLEKDGFTVSNIGNYDPGILEKTKIIIPNEGMGEDLSQYFKDPAIELSEKSLPEGVDIRIIIGTNDKDNN